MLRDILLIHLPACSKTYSEKHISEVIYCGREIILKTEKIARTQKKNITSFKEHNLIPLCQTSITYRGGNDILKLTFIITSHRKVIKRYSNTSFILRQKILNRQRMARVTQSTAFCFPSYRRVNLRKVELFIDQVAPFIALIRLSFIQ